MVFAAFQFPLRIRRGGRLLFCFILLAISNLQLIFRSKYPRALWIGQTNLVPLLRRVLNRWVSAPPSLKRYNGSASTI